MKKQYRLSRLAASDLRSIWRYLNEHESLDVADMVIDDLYAGMERLSKSPGIGHFRKDLTSLPVRFFRVHRFLILYAPDEKPVGIVRVLHGSRDIPAVLRGE